MQSRLLPARLAARVAAWLLGLGALPLPLPLGAQPALRGALTPEVESGAEWGSSPARPGELRPRSRPTLASGAQEKPATAGPVLDVAAACTDSARASGPLTEMDSGTALLIRPGQAADHSPVTPIGFDFLFQGTRQDRFSVTVDGVFRFGATPVADVLPDPPRSASTAANATGPRPRSAICKVHSKVLGTAPHRTLVVEWLSFPSPAEAVDAPRTPTYQLRLFETTGAIEFASAKRSPRPTPGPSYSPSPPGPAAP